MMRDSQSTLTWSVSPHVNKHLIKFPVLGMFHAFLRWKDKVYRQLFYMTDYDRSPNFLSRDASYILAVLKPCYTVEKTRT